MRASVISGCDTPPVLEFAEHVLDLVALLVEVGVVFDLLLAVFSWRDTRLDNAACRGHRSHDFLKSASVLSSIER